MNGGQLPATRREKAPPGPGRAPVQLQNVVPLPASPAGQAPLAPAVPPAAGAAFQAAGGRADPVITGPFDFTGGGHAGAPAMDTAGGIGAGGAVDTGVASAAALPSLFAGGAGRLLRVPGQEGLVLVGPGIPIDPGALVALLRAALGDDVEGTGRFGGGPAALVERMMRARTAPMTVLEVLRIGDRASWVAARALYEQQTGRTLLGSVRDALSERDFGAAVPYLRGVVPTVDLVRIWSGVFSSDVAGVVRTLERMPDAEVLGMIADFRLAGDLTGASSAIVDAVVDVTGTEDDGAYRALRALTARVARVAAAAGPGLEQADRDAARDLAHQLRIRAAFARVQEADREGRPELAYLAVAELAPMERYYLDANHLRDWKGRHLTGKDRNRLQMLLDSNDDVDVILSALEDSRWAAEQTGDAENAYGVGVAAEALGPALRNLADRASDQGLPETERVLAADRLADLAADQHVVDRLLDLPGGERLLREGLGLSRSDIARRRLLRATSVADVVTALRGLHSLDVSALLGDRDVDAHLKRQEVVVGPHVLRVLDAYGQLSGATVDPLLALPPGSTPPLVFLPATGVIDTSGLDLAGVDPAGEDDWEEEPPSLELSLPTDPDAPDPLVVVAGYEAFRAAADDDLAGVVAAVRPLRRSQRAELQDDTYFAAALATLRETRWDETPRIVADAIADPFGDLTAATDALVAAGLMGRPGEAFHVRDERLLAEGLAVEPADRKLLRYRYVLDALEDENRQQGRTDYWSARGALLDRGVPAELDIGDRLETAYTDRTFAISNLAAVPRLRAEAVFLGEPDVMRGDLTPEELALEAEFMRVRLDAQLRAAAEGIDASAVFGWSPETLTEAAGEFQRLWAQHPPRTPWTQPELVILAAAYYDALDALDRNRTERDTAASFVGNLAAVVASIVVIAATGGAATPGVLAFLGKLGAGAVIGGAAQQLVASGFRDYTSPDQALEDFGSGAVTGALNVAGEVLARPVAGALTKRLAEFAARSALRKAAARGVVLAAEGAIGGAVGGFGEAVFRTAIDRTTWERGVTAIFARFLSAAAQGTFWGAVAGAVAAPVVGGTIAAGGWLLRSAGVIGAASGARAALDNVAAFADQGRFDVALRELDTLALTGAERDAITQHLYRRALGSSADGAAVPDHVLAELEQARQVTRSLAEAADAAPGARPRLDVAPVEELLAKLEGRLGAVEIAHVRKIVYSEIRLAPEELIPRRHEFTRGLESALDDLATPAERAAIPPFEVRVLPSEAFEGMFRNERGRALTLLEGDRAVIYAAADADVRTFALQEAAHLRQLADPAFAADVRLLSERNVLGWAAKSAEERLHFLAVQRRLEIDAQQRIVRALEPEVPYATGTDAAEELAVARSRLTELQRHEAEAAAITPAELSEMNAGIRRRPPWMEDEARLFGTVTRETRPALTDAELVKNPVKVQSSGAKKGEQAWQLGHGWQKRTYVTSGIDGTVTADDVVDGVRVIEVTPKKGLARQYMLEPGGTLEPGLAVGKEVARGDPLGGWNQEYRLVEFRGGPAARRVEEVLDVHGRWVERGSSRTTRGEVMEEAAEIQIRRQLQRAVDRPAVRDPLRHFIVVERGTARSGFDRVVVEFRGQGADTRAVIRVLEVKDYPNQYVPLAEFTAIVDNFDVNLATLNEQLGREIEKLALAGRAAEARALQATVDAKALQVEIWLGPTTRMGKDESVAGSVLGRLRTDIAGHGPNIRLVDRKPTRIFQTSQREALAARAAKKGR